MSSLVKSGSKNELRYSSSTWMINFNYIHQLTTNTRVEIAHSFEGHSKEFRGLRNICDHSEASP